MNKNFKVITINGVRGIIMAIFVVMGLIAGFVISPGWVCMQGWNYFMEGSNTVSTMNIYQGIMMWAIIALSLYALNNKKALIGFGSYKGLSPEQIKDIMQRSKDVDFETIKRLEALRKNMNNHLQEEAMKNQKVILPKSTSEDVKHTEEVGK